MAEDFAQGVRRPRQPQMATDWVPADSADVDVEPFRKAMLATLGTLKGGLLGEVVGSGLSTPSLVWFMIGTTDVDGKLHEFVVGGGPSREPMGFFEFWTMHKESDEGKLWSSSRHGGGSECQSSTPDEMEEQMVSHFSSFYGIEASPTAPVHR